MIITRKIELKINNEEEKKWSLNLLKEYYNAVPIMSNLAVKEILLNDLLVEKVAKQLMGYKETVEKYENNISELYEEIKNLEIEDKVKKDKILAKWGDDYYKEFDII